MDNPELLTIQNPNKLQRLIDSTPLPNRVVEQLRSRIMDGTLKPGTRLPTEPELARTLNISRSTLRASLNSLEHQGLIIRKRGIGTFIANKPLIVNNLNFNNGVTQLIRSHGDEPGISELHCAIRSASTRVAERLAVEPGTPIISIERVRTANGKPVVLTLDYLPHSLLSTSERNFTLDEVNNYLVENQSIYLFLSNVLKIDIHHAIAWIRPVAADIVTSEKLQVPFRSSILYTEQVDYDLEENPKVLADEFYIAEAFTFAVYRTL